MHFHLQLVSEITELPSRWRFQRWIKAALEHAKKSTDIEITLRIVDEEESAELNETHRHKKGPTNVLSFPYEKVPGMDWNYLGDIVICAPVVLKEAEQQNKSPLAHWAHLTVHGALHLYGYDHIEEKDAVIMEGLEIAILNKLKFANPYDSALP